MFLLIIVIVILILTAIILETKCLRKGRIYFDSWFRMLLADISVEQEEAKENNTIWLPSPFFPFVFSSGTCPTNWNHPYLSQVFYIKLIFSGNASKTYNYELQ